MSDLDNVTDMEPEAKKSKYSVKNVALGLILLGFVIVITVDSFTTRYVANLSMKFLEVVEDLGFVGILLFCVVYIAATVLLIPGTILTVGAGFVFTHTNDGNQVIGTLISTAVVLIGATVGSTMAYLLAKYLFRKRIAEWAAQYKIFNAVDKAIENNGLKITFLLRLSPVLPYNVLNYLLGITALNLRDYLLACLGFIPGTAAFCYIGSTLSSFTDVAMNGMMEDNGSSRTVRLIILVIGIIASILAVVAVTFYARRELRKHLDETEDSENPSSQNKAEIQES